MWSISAAAAGAVLSTEELDQHDTAGGGWMYSERIQKNSLQDIWQAYIENKTYNKYMKNAINQERVGKRTDDKTATQLLLR